MLLVLLHISYPWHVATADSPPWWCTQSSGSYEARGKRRKLNRHRYEFSTLYIQTPRPCRLGRVAWETVRRTPGSRRRTGLADCIAKKAQSVGRAKSFRRCGSRRRGCKEKKGPGAVMSLRRSCRSDGPGRVEPIESSTCAGAKPALGTFRSAKSRIRQPCRFQHVIQSSGGLLLSHYGARLPKSMSLAARSSKRSTSTVSGHNSGFASVAHFLLRLFEVPLFP